MLYRKEIIQHAHIQSFPEPAWSGDKRHGISVFPPFSDEIRLIDVKIIIFNYLFKILMTNRNGSRYYVPPLSVNPLVSFYPYFRLNTSCFHSAGSTFLLILP